jgi:competence protein ComGC
MMARRRNDRGLTLIEILLSLIVMVLGVVGILALFPPAMQSANESVEDTNAAVVSESVAHSLVNAFNFANWDPATLETTVTLTHDLDAGGTKIRFAFKLPKLDQPGTEDWWHFPSAVPAPQPDPGQKLPLVWDPENDNRIFKMSADHWTNLTVQGVHDTNDLTDPYRQYAFSFDMRKINTLEHLVGKPNPDKPGENYKVDDLDPLCKLYEFRINVFRVATPAGSTGGGSGTSVVPGGGGGAEFRRLIAIITKRIAAK